MRPVPAPLPSGDAEAVTCHGGGTRLEGLLLALLLLAAYRLLRQEIFYGDGSFIAIGRASGELLHTNHLLNYLVTAAGEALVAPLVADGFDRMTWSMHLCTALAAWLFHGTLGRLGFARGPRWLGTLLFGAGGGVLFYATAIERQAPFLPFAALAFDALVRCGQSPSARRGLWLGATTALATTVHTTGHFLLALTAAWLWFGCERRTGSRRDAVVAGVVAAAVHMSMALALTWLLTRLSGHDSVGNQLGVLKGFGRFAPGLFLANLRDEWLLPLLPGSVLFALLLWHPRASVRSLARAVALTLLPYQALSFVLLRDFDERGAYNLPLALPLAVLLLRWLPVRGLLLATACALGTGLWLNRQYAATMPHPPDAGQVESVIARGQAVVLFVGPWSMRPILRHFPGVRTVDLVALAQSNQPFAQVCASFDQGFTLASAAGFRAVIAQQCLDLIATLPLPAEQMRFFHEHFLVRYRFTPGQAADFRYALVEPKR